MLTCEPTGLHVLQNYCQVMLTANKGGFSHKHGTAV